MKNNFFIKTGLLVAIMAYLLQPTKGQEFLPFVNDNYAGITGVHLNPASIANSRYIVDVELAGISADFHNNYLYSNFKDVTKAVLEYKTRDISVLGGPNALFKENLNGKNKFLNAAASVSALNFMFSINPKWAIGVTGRVRTFLNFNNVNEDVISMGLNDFSLSNHYFNGSSDRQYSLEEFGFNVSTFAEYGVTVAGVLWDSKNHHHFLKAGLSGHLLQGLGSAYLNSSDMMVEFY
ncbi:MAG: hypothetical protein LBV46_00985, partial [Bacteroidales bacterium]|nr:hypothetical protein [Bacteroidales bacterium]